MDGTNVAHAVYPQGGIELSHKRHEAQGKLCLEEPGGHDAERGQAVTSRQRPYEPTARNTGELSVRGRQVEQRLAGTGGDTEGADFALWVQFLFGVQTVVDATESHADGGCLAESVTCIYRNKKRSTDLNAKPAKYPAERTRAAAGNRRNYLRIANTQKN